MDQDELQFFHSKLELLPLYLALRERLSAVCPGTDIRVGKTQISFVNRHIFAMASLPRRIKGWPETYLLVSFGLPARMESPRIRQAVEPYPNRWTHHVPIATMDEIDRELLDWLREACAFSMAK